MIFEIRGKAKITCESKTPPITTNSWDNNEITTIRRTCTSTRPKSILYFETSVDSGIERSRSEFKKGDIAYLPSSGSICFFKDNVKSAKKMTPIGRIREDVEVLDDVKSGDVFCIYEEAD